MNDSGVVACNGNHTMACGGQLIGLKLSLQSPRAVRLGCLGGYASLQLHSFGNSSAARRRKCFCHDLIVFIAGDPDQIPFAGSYEGQQEFWSRFFALIERYDKTACRLQFFVCRNEVVAYGAECGRIIEHSIDEPTWLCLKLEVQNGQIVRFEDYYDTASAQSHIAQFHDQMKAQES